MILLALALAAQGNFTETFERGQTVNLSNGFYICRGKPVANVLESIALFRDQRTRKNKARSLGCPLHQSELPAVTEVQEVVAAYCGPMVPVNGGMMCRNEAYQLKVGNSRHQTTVIFVLDDYAID